MFKKLKGKMKQKYENCEPLSIKCRAQSIPFFTFSYPMKDIDG